MWRGCHFDGRVSVCGWEWLPACTAHCVAVFCPPPAEHSTTDDDAAQAPKQERQNTEPQRQCESADAWNTENMQGKSKGRTERIASQRSASPPAMAATAAGTVATEAT